MPAQQLPMAISGQGASAEMKEMTATIPKSVKKNISGISIIFDWGLQDRGENAGLYSQADIVDSYGLRLNEELDYENVRTHYIDTRRAPVRDEAKRLHEVPDGFIPVFLSCDWHDRKREHNASVVEFSDESLYKLAESICFSLTEWGNCYVWKHRVSRPVLVPSDKCFLRIKPFALNGPHADEYTRRLDKLGEDLGRAIGGYLSERNQGLRR